MFVLIVAIVVALSANAAATTSPAVTVSEKDGVYSVAATFTSAQTPWLAVAALTDYAQIPRFMPEVRLSRVLERADDRAVVEQEAVARFMMFSKRVHLVLEIEEERGAAAVIRVIRFRNG